MQEFVYNLTNPQKVIVEWFEEEKIEISNDQPQPDEEKQPASLVKQDIYSLSNKEKSVKTETQSEDQFEP